MNASGSGYFPPTDPAVTKKFTLILYLWLITETAKANFPALTETCLADLPQYDVNGLLPRVTSDGHDLNQGSGGESHVLTATTADNRRVAVKILNQAWLNDLKQIKKTEIEMIQSWHRIARELEAYGGPPARGIVEVQDQNGIWRPGVAMDIVEGTDVKTLLNLKREGKPLPFPVTAAHVEAMRNLMARSVQNGHIFSDVALGDFILLPNGSLVPVDLGIGKRELLPPTDRASATYQSDARMRDVLEAIESLAK